jgi:hypothetical protein
MCTYNKTKWKLGEWKETSGEANRLCSNSWLHAYSHPLLAAMYYSIHTCYGENQRFFKAEWDGKMLKNCDKVGVSKMRLIKEIQLPEITTFQRVKITIKAILKLETNKFDKKLQLWAEEWLNGKDRSKDPVYGQGLYSLIFEYGVVSRESLNIPVGYSYKHMCNDTAADICSDCAYNGVDIKSIIEEVLEEDARLMPHDTIDEVRNRMFGQLVYF